MGLKIPTFLEKIIYDPVKGRFFYDFLLSLIGPFVILGVFLFFDYSSTYILLPAYYSFFFLLSNIILGLYGKNKTASLIKKIMIILCSNAFSFVLLIAIFNNSFLFSLFFIVSTITTTFPRFFLNFNVERTTFGKISSAQNEGPILVVGGGGYIGSVLVEQLLNKGEKVRVFDKFIYSKDVFKGIRNSKNLELFEGDISDIYSLTLAVKDSKAIIHLAGIVGDPAARIDEKLTRHVNIASTRLLKETAKAFGVKKFIFASSCSVYGTTSKLQTESSKTKPISLYAKTKIDSEKELLSDTADNFHPTILRFATVFGHSRKPRFDLVVNLFVAEAYFKKLIKIEGGDQWRPFIHVKDIARAIITILEAPNNKISRQVFNVGDDNMNTTIKDLSSIIKNTVGNHDTKIIVLHEKRDKRDYRVSFEKIRKELNFYTTISLTEGINEIYKNFLNNKYKLEYKDPFYINYEITKELKKEFRSKKYMKTHFSSIS